MSDGQPGDLAAKLLAEIAEFCWLLTEEQVTGLLDGSLRLTVTDAPAESEPKITPCPRCAGEGCSNCDDTGVIYP